MASRAIDVCSQSISISLNNQITEQDLLPLFLRWDGSDQAWKEYDKSLWTAYSEEVTKELFISANSQDNVKLEVLYQNWKGSNRDEMQEIDEAYSVNFSKMQQCRTINTYRRRSVKSNRLVLT